MKKDSFKNQKYQKDQKDLKDLKDRMEKSEINLPFKYTVKKSKTHKNLRLIVSEFDSDEPKINELARFYNGVIYDITEVPNFNLQSIKKFVCKSFDKVEDIRDKFKENADYSIDLEWTDNIKNIYKLEEGTFLRYYFYNDEWIVSTLKCIDTRETFINGSKKNFTDMFLEASEGLDTSLLNKSYTYCFLLNHCENRCIIDYQGAPSLTYLGYVSVEGELYSENYVNDTKDIEKSFLNTKNISIQVPLEVEDHHKFIREDLVNPSYPLEFKGYMFEFKNDTRITTLFDYYLYLHEIRGTNCNIKIRYLELQDYNDKQNLIRQFKELTYIEKELEEKTKLIYSSYVEVNITKTKKKGELKRLYKIIYDLHGFYLFNKKQMIGNGKCPIIYDDVLRMFYSLKPKEIAWLMNWI